MKAINIGIITGLSIMGATTIVVPTVIAATESKQQTYETFNTDVISSFFNQMLELTTNKQLKNKRLWKKFVDVFKDHEDTKEGAGANWRCEFWGKMMRGACLTYAYSQDPELYEVITETVLDMLERGQDRYGRFSTYEQSKEFHWWDLWGRKYILTAMLHYYEICKDNVLKNRIVNSLRRHVDYIVSKIGKASEGKIEITETGYAEWKSINSSSILEPIVNFYEITHEQRYLDFAKYIVDSGGIQGGNIIDEAKDLTKKPADFSVRKSYETMSFFEGVYRYARVINDQELKNICISYFERVAENEVTVVGGSGCHEEQFNNSAETQTIRYKRTGESTPHFGQETCVTVTWMRILNLLYEETGNIKYYERFSQAALNVFLGTLNLYNQKTCEGYLGKAIEGIPFDSYSPLYNDPRGVCTGGLVKFLEQSQSDIPLYGCCVCIAPAAIGLMGLNYCRTFQDKMYLNEYYEANVHNNGTMINVGGDYLSNGRAWININSSSNEQLMLRIPAWANNPEIKINGIVNAGITPNSYFNAGALKDIKTISVQFNPRVIKAVAGKGPNEKVYFKYGQYVLAVDQINNPHINDLSWIDGSDIDPISFTQVPCAPDEFVRFEAPYHNTKLIFTNYAAAGRKNWWQSHSNCNLTVFFNQDEDRIPYDYLQTNLDDQNNTVLQGFNLEYKRINNMGDYHILTIPKNIDYIAAQSFNVSKENTLKNETYDSPEAIKTINFEQGCVCKNFAQQPVTGNAGVNFWYLPNLETVIFPPQYVGSEDVSLFANCAKLSTLNFYNVNGPITQNPRILIGANIAKTGKVIIKKGSAIKSAAEEIVDSINYQTEYSWQLVEAD